MTKKCMKCGGAMKKMAVGGSTTNKLNSPKKLTKPQTGGTNTELGIYGIPNAGRTDQLGFKKGGAVKKMQKGGSMFVPTPKPKMTVNTNPVKKSKYTTAPRKIPMAQNGGVTVTNQKISPNDPYERAKRVLSSKASALDKMKKLQVDNYKKQKNTNKKLYQNGGATKPAAKPKPKYVYGDVPGIGGPAPGQAATPGETILFDQKFAAERKAKAAAAKRKTLATKKGK